MIRDFSEKAKQKLEGYADDAAASSTWGKINDWFSDRGMDFRSWTKGKEQKLLGLIREGMALITPESPNLTDYLYDWAYEEERDFYPVGMESQVMLVYSTDDTLAECMKGFMNSDYQ